MILPEYIISRLLLASYKETRFKLSDLRLPVYLIQRGYRYCIIVITLRFNMTSVATSLSKALPKPKYTGEDETLPSKSESRGPRVLGPSAVIDTQLVVKVFISYIYY